MTDYDPKSIENKWQKEWETSNIYQAQEGSEKHYTLVEFPYPSGNLHVGHWYAFSVPDIYARYQRMQGKSVLYPIGFDAFGLPAENAAIQRGLNPRKWTEENMEYMRKQLRSMGASFDWSREVVTCDPNYYKWTQWQFKKFFEKGLIYQKESEVNWCPKDKTVLANEQVVNDRCERCDSLVEKRNMLQWNIKITDYADRLINDLEGLDWPHAIKQAQRNWIGPSQGALIKFDDIEIYTTRPDTIYGATFLVKSGKEDKFTGEYVTNPATKEKIPVWEAEYVYSDYGTGAIMAVPAHDERDYAFAKKHNLPIKQVIEPVVSRTAGEDAFRPSEKISERNAVVAIVKHWSEDKYLGAHWLKTNWKGFVIGGIEDGEDPKTAGLREIGEETGYLNPEFVEELGGTINARFFQMVKGENRVAHFKPLLFKLKDGERKETSEEEKSLNEFHWLTPEEMERFITNPDMRIAWNRSQSNDYYAAPGSTHGSNFDESGILINSGEFNGLTIEESQKKITQALGQWVNKYRLRDWVVSRQRYWGVPIPIIHCAKCGAQPVRDEDLPVLLPEIDDYLPRDDGKSPLAKATDWVKTKCPKCGGDAERETDTLDTFVDSSWYYLRYTDPENTKEFAAREKQDHWMPIDLYSGGSEHTTMHLLYSRFWHKVLFDLGLVKDKEPYLKRMNRGLIMGPDGQKMSKSKGNVIDPDKEVERLGADTVRTYLAFIGPYNEVGSYPWNPDGAVGVRRFLERVWKFQDKLSDSPGGSTLIHKTIRDVSEDIANLKMNTAVSALMILINDFMKQEKIAKEDYATLLKLLAPFAPHIAEELWHELGNSGSIHTQAWPTYDESKLQSEKQTLAVQVNGKVRATLETHPGESEEEVKSRALALPEVLKWLDGKAPIKVIVVPQKIVSIVI